MIELIMVEKPVIGVVKKKQNCREINLIFARES